MIYIYIEYISYFNSSILIYQDYPSFERPKIQDLSSLLDPFNSSHISSSFLSKEVLIISSSI